MKLIWITPECPYPANSGGRLGIWKRISYLAETNEIYLFSIIDNVLEEIYRDDIKKVCKDATFYLRRRDMEVYLKSIILPYPAASRRNAKMCKDIETFSELIHPDYILVDTPLMMINISSSVKKLQRVILNQHNIEFLAMQDISKNMSFNFKKIAYKFVAKQQKKYEEKIYKNDNISIYTFVSSSDKTYFEKNYKSKQTYLFPVGSEIKNCEPVNSVRQISFIAKMSYPPNESGAIWFLDNVWDQILINCPDVTLSLVGREPSETLYESAKKHRNVIITGMVESVEEYYDKSSFIIIPLLSGGGVKVKLLEALGHGKIVITTSKGIEGTDFLHNKHVLEANTSREFADYCIDVLLNIQKYERLRMNALLKVKSEYSWKSIVGKFEKYLIEVSEIRG